MKRFTQLLAVVLVVQVMLAFLTHQYSKKEASASTPLIHIGSDTVSRLHIIEKDKPELSIIKKDGIWVLPDLFGAVAEKSMIETVMQKIEGLKSSWPVATSSSAAVRFHVAKDDFKEKITLQLDDGSSTVLYLGDSAGARTSYLRFNDNNEIYRAALNAYDFPSDPNNWIDSRQITLDQKSITSVKFNDVFLKREGDLFLLENANKSNQNAGKITETISAICSPQLKGILSLKEEAAYNLKEPALKVVITKNDGKKIEYHYGKPEKEDYYVLKTSDNKYYFKVAVWQVDQLLQSSAKSLLKEGEQGDKIEPAAVVPSAQK